MNTLASVILSALQDTRDGGYTIEERAEAIAAAVREGRQVTPTEPEVIAKRRAFVVKNADHVRDNDPLRMTWGEYREVLSYIDAIVAERDAAVRERENVSSQLWDCMNERDGYKEKYAAICAHMNQVHEVLGGTDTVLTLEAALHVMTRLAACERVVKVACEYADMLERYEYGDDVSDHNDDLLYEVRIYLAAVATAQGDA